MGRPLRLTATSGFFLVLVACVTPAVSESEPPTTPSGPEAGRPSVVRIFDVELPNRSVSYSSTSTKAINDQFGHEAGDQALKAFGEILHRTLRESDLAARLGGDEFAALIWTANQVDLVSVRARIEHQVQAHNATSRPGLELAFSMGVSWFNPELPQSLDQLVQTADVEMYCQKRERQLQPVTEAILS